MTIKPSRYKTFLLTVWEERSLKQPQASVWRFGLEDPQSGRRRAFSSLEALGKALQQMIGATEAADESPRGFSLRTPGPSLPGEQGPASSDNQ